MSEGEFYVTYSHDFGISPAIVDAVNSTKAIYDLVTTGKPTSGLEKAEQVVETGDQIYESAKGMSEGVEEIYDYYLTDDIQGE